MKFRGFMYGIFMKGCGVDFQVTHNAIIKDLGNIEVGKNVFIGNFSMIMGSGNINLGNNVLIGPHVMIVSGNHTFDGKSYNNNTFKEGSVIVEEGCWIGSQCTLVIGSKLPKGSVLSANSMLNKKFDTEYSIYAGNPAKYIKTHFPRIN